MFENLLMAKLLLYFFNTAVLFVEIDGRLPTERTLASKINVSLSSESAPSAAQHYLPSPTLYTVYNGRVVPESTSILSQLLMKSQSQMDKKLSTAQGTEVVTSKLGSKRQRNETSELDLDKHNFREHNTGEFLKRLSKGIHNYIQNIPINTPGKGTKQSNSTIDTDQSTKQAKDFTETTLLEHKTVSWQVTEADTLGTSSISPHTALSLQPQTPAESNLRGYVMNAKRSFVASKRFFPFEVAVVVSRPKGPQRNSIIFVPLMVDMTILDAFISATRTYTHYDNSSKEDIPFNIRLDWNEDLKCVVTVEAVGIKSRRKRAWYFTVRNYKHEIVYKGRCLQDENVILRPRSSVQLTFEHTRRRSN